MKNFTKSLKTLFLILIISNLAQAQVYEKGKVVIDAYYGFPNLWTSILQSEVNNSTTAQNAGVTVSSIGPLGGRIEYLLSSKIGFGVDFSYANTTAKYTDQSTNYNYQISIPRWRVVPRINIHLGHDTKLDPYFAFGVGYVNSSYSYKTNDPNYTGLATTRSLVPVSVMAKFGMRYFITDHIGLGVEVGLGGPLATGGVTVKF
jgi:hypothetical protein